MRRTLKPLRMYPELQRPDVLVTDKLLVCIAPDAAWDYTRDVSAP
jgi:hypothetical protein